MSGVPVQIASGADVARELGREHERARETQLAAALRQRAFGLEDFPGAVQACCLSTAPAGWVRADGQGITAALPRLRAALIADGSPHGTDGSGDPRVPDYNNANRFLRGAATPGGSGGAASHSHGVVVSGTTAVPSFPGGTGDPGLQSGTQPLHNHAFTGGGSTDAQSSLPPYGNVVYFVKT